MQKNRGEGSPRFFCFLGGKGAGVGWLLWGCGGVGVLLDRKLTAGTKSSLFGAGTVFGIGILLLFGSLLERLRGGRLLFPLR
ncbi:MAG: hypothetical protein LBQ91_02530, partial [Oscillospiraceae bacterium]|nr:hypothetical protein [Oscillospiraceae bacterium]